MDRTAKIVPKSHLNLKSEHVIELGLRLVKHTDADETSDQGVTFKEATWVLVFKSQELTGRTTNVG